MAAPADFSGTWKLDSTSENYEEFLTANGVGLIMRKAIVNLSPEITIVQDGDNFHTTTKTAIKNKENKFKIGEEFESKHPLKDEMQKLLVTWDGDVLVTKVVGGDDDSKGAVFRRFLDEDGKMVINQKAKGVEAYRKFVKIR